MKTIAIFVLILCVVLVVYNVLNWQKFEKQEVQRTRNLVHFIELSLQHTGKDLKRKEKVLLHQPREQLKNFHYLLSPNDCYVELVRGRLLGLLLITSYVGHRTLRNVHRNALNQTYLNSLGFRRVFLLAAVPKTEYFVKQYQLEDEQRKYGDLIQGDFQDTYRNLSYKHSMGLGWAVYNCYLETYFYVKLDDDIVFDIFHLREYLLHLIESRDRLIQSNHFISGYITNASTPIREKNNKWYVSYEEYPHEQYPASVSGWLYITTPATAARIFQLSQILWQKSKVFWIDDIWITGIIRERLGIPLRQEGIINDWFTPSGALLACCIKDLKESHLECPYYVGPNDGDSQRLLSFLSEIQKCYTNSTQCVKRTQRHLHNTCVGIYRKYLPEHGVPKMVSIKL